MSGVMKLVSNCPPIADIDSLNTASILSVFLGKFLLMLFYLEPNNTILYWVIRVLIIFPLYQLLLIVVGTIFGEFKYFWNIEKKILKRLKIIKSSSS